MAFCGFHRRTIARFSLANANTMANKRIITVCRARAIRFTSAPAMFKCIRIIIVRIRPSCKKGKKCRIYQSNRTNQFSHSRSLLGFNDFGQRKNAMRTFAPLSGSAPLISIAFATVAITHLKTKRKWVSTAYWL